MDLVNMTREQRLEMQRKRIAYFKEIAQQYNSLQDFIKDNDEKFAIVGIELRAYKNHISLYMQLDYSEYDEYFIIMTSSGHLTCSPIVGFQDEYCANFQRNTDTGEYVDDEDEK